MNKPVHIYAEDVNPDTMEQFTNCAKCDFVVEAALMPDAHLGYVAPVGAVLKTKSFLVPAWVGYDIGCGLTAVKLRGIQKKDIQNTEDIYKAVDKAVPMGLGKKNRYKDISKETNKKYQEILSTFEQKPHDHNIYQFFDGSAVRHLGSLGSGNHFIELGYSGEDIWLVIHSGSRGVGYKVAKKYMKRSAGTEKNYEETNPIHEDSELGKEYKAILDFGLKFAELNREEMVKKTVKAVQKVMDTEITYEEWTNKNHNHALKENGYYIHRKGATPAKQGERGVIPANMRDGSYLVKGKGNKKFLESSSHGAGRVMSRSGAKKNISLDEFKQEMKDVKGTVSEKTLDEAPQAYKDITAVLAAQQESIDVVKHIKPLVNWKGA